MKIDNYKILCDMNLRLILPWMVLILLIIPIQVFSLIKISPVDTLESSKIATGADNVYYLDGALSILEYDADKKFNDKRQPIFGSNFIEKEKFPEYTSAIAILYPYSAFKYGYSVSVAIITAVIPKKFFEKYIPRLAFANFIFTIISILLIYRILENLSFNLWSKIFAGLLVALDPFLAQTNYAYQSHTICGIMYVLAFISIFTNKSFDMLNNSSGFFCGFLFTAAILSSSHFIFLLISLVILIFIYILKIKFKIVKKIKFIFIFLIGSSILPSYILVVENYINFKKLGLNTFLSQNLEYARVVSSLVDTYSILNRKIWNYEIWNQYFYLVVCILLINFLVNNIHKKNIYIDYFKNIISKKNGVIFLASLLSIILGSIFTQPLVRALVPELFILNVYVGAILGVSINYGLISSVLSAVIIFLYSMNYYDFYKSISGPGYSFAFWQKTPSSVVRIQDKTIIWDGIKEFHKTGGVNLVPVSNLGIYSISLDEFIKKSSLQFGTLPEKIPDNVWVEINPMDIVEQYSHTRRFINQFNQNKKNIVTRQNIEKDFMLFFDIFKYIDSGQLSEKSYYSLPVWHYSPTFFDQEYNYIYGYNGKIKKYLRNTPLENIEFRKLYFINLHDLSLLHTQLNN
jgi:hypothetical protein